MERVRIFREEFFCALTGATLADVEDWIDMGDPGAVGANAGVGRLFNFQEAVAVIAAMELRALGIAPENLRTIARSLAGALTRIAGMV